LSVADWQDYPASPPKEWHEERLLGLAQKRSRLRSGNQQGVLVIFEATN
jgi:hypothetical protein